MTTQLLIYENVVPVSKQRHANWSVEVGGDYAFSRKVNSVPLLAVEFPLAAAEYPIVFSGNDQAVMPVAVLGLGTENQYLGEDGAWQGRYIPAFLRRYPFVFSSADEGKTFTLCIDESYGGFNQEGRGARLFEDGGNPAPYVQNVLKFLQEYQNQFRRTEVYCAKVKNLNVLEPMQAQVTQASGAKSQLVGFSGINRDKLKGVTGDSLAELAKTDELELCYLQLQSMRNFPRVMERGAAQAAAAPAPAPAAAGETAPEEKQRATGRAAGRRK
jgi:hypothetical protein